MKRYGPSHAIIEFPDGEYVKYEDAKSLHEALTKLVECIEVIKHDRQDEGTEPDWFDWVFINQELKRSKEALREGV